MSDATITREDLQLLAETAERFAKTEIAPKDLEPGWAA